MSRLLLLLDAQAGQTPTDLSTVLMQITVAIKIAMVLTTTLLQHPLALVPLSEM